VLLDQIGKYRKRWNEGTGRYLDEPLHTIASNYADAFQYAMQAVGQIETVSSMKGSLEQHRKVVDARSKIIVYISG